MTDREKVAMAALDPAVLAATQAPPADAKYIAPGVTCEPMFARAMAAYDAMRNELVTFNAWKQGLEFDVPMFFLQGEDDMMTVASEVERYAAEIRAPQKRFVPVKGSGHSTHLLRDELLRLLETLVRPVAAPATE
jgi:pimeloyl-ACP methyl ester carboxylesterase